MMYCTHPSLCLYLEACFSCLFALLSSNVNPLASNFTDSMKNTKGEGEVVMICAAMMPTSATAAGRNLELLHVMVERNHVTVFGYH